MPHITQPSGEEFIWTMLQSTKRPVVLYGMGDGADKALDACARYGVPIQGVFASPGFVRGQSFRQWKVESLEDIEARLSDFIILMCFATQRPEVLRMVREIADRHTLLVPDLPVCGTGLFTPDSLIDYGRELETLYGLLADEHSRRVLEQLLRYKLTGVPQRLWDCETPKEEAYTHLLRPGSEEHFVDAGAYTGDTVEEFLRYADGYKSILALEPDRRNYKKLRARLENLGGDVRHLQIALWSHKANLSFDHASGRQAALSESAGGATSADSLDNLLCGKPATLIKFDVEGAEREALLGCREAISAYKPKLAVSVYHRTNDFFELPLLIHKLCPEYRLYLRHHPYLPAWETCCYAIT